MTDQVPPYDEDGYCEFCGNGRWKPHGYECEWADALDPALTPEADQADRISELAASAGFELDEWQHRLLDSALRAALDFKQAQRRVERVFVGPAGVDPAAPTRDELDDLVDVSHLFADPDPLHDARIMAARAARAAADAGLVKRGTR